MNDWSWMDDVMTGEQHWDRDGNPIRPSEWFHRFMVDETYKQVAFWEDPIAAVSTVWLGRDPYRNEPPLIFETMAVFDGSWRTRVFWRWSTLAKAEAGHAKIVATIQQLGARDLAGSTGRTGAMRKLTAQLMEATGGWAEPEDDRSEQD